MARVFDARVRDKERLREQRIRHSPAMKTIYSMDRRSALLDQLVNTQR